MVTHLERELRELALGTGAHVMGVASLDRFAHCPKPYHPTSFLPDAKSVIVVGVHYPDACVEFCGGDDLQEMGPYGVVQVDMNVLLDLLSYRIAKSLDEQGFPSLSFSTSHIWRYRPFEEIERCFTPDFPHRHAAVAAGLGGFGWNGLVITEAFGPRIRFNSIITTAELPATPLYEGPALCDKCMRCVKHCRMDTFRKETSGLDRVVIGDREYRFPLTNKWRCAWAEHFALSLDVAVPDRIDEEAVLAAKRTHGVHGGEIGNCLRHCLPPHLRTQRTEGVDVWQRKKVAESGDLSAILRELESRLLPQINYLSVIPVEQLPADLAMRSFPGARSIVLLGAITCKDLPDLEVANRVGGLPMAIQDATIFLREEANRILGLAGLAVARLAEEHGYEAMPRIAIDGERLAAASAFGEYTGDGRVFHTPAAGTNQLFTVIATSMPLPAYAAANLPQSAEPPTREGLRQIAQEAGAQLFGVTPLSRLEGFDAVSRLQACYRGLKHAIVIGMHYPDAYLQGSAGAPTGALGPYSFSQYQVHRELGFIARDICGKLAGAGYEALPVLDLCETASKVSNVRGTPPPGAMMERGMIGLLPYAFLPDSRSNSYAAVASGLGTIGYNGCVLTPQYGPRQRFICIVTDLPLEADPMRLFDPGCAACRRCLAACPTGAISQTENYAIRIGDATIQVPRMKSLACDWAKRFGLSAAEGPALLGSTTDVPAPEEITLCDLAEALKQRDELQDHFSVVMEPCIKACPAPFPPVE